MQVENAELLTRVFGRWPSFHDAEILAIRLDRGSGVSVGPSLEADVHLFEMTSEVLPTGFYVLRNHTLVSLRFDEIDNMKLADFNHQNVIYGLTLEDVSAQQLERVKWKVSFDPSYGVSAEFECRTVGVVAAAPYVPQCRVQGPLNREDPRPA
jgi:hypothetical protein